MDMKQIDFIALQPNTENMNKDWQKYKLSVQTFMCNQ